MKSAMIKVLLLVLCLSMVIPFAACGQTNEDPAETGSNTNAGDVTEAVTENKPYVESKDYGEKFTAVYCSDIFQKGYFFCRP